MKPERIQFAPWLTQWQRNLPFVRKDYACESLAEASHYAEHVERVARFDTTSDVMTSINEDSIAGTHVVTVKIAPSQTETLSDDQFALGQWIDEALSYLQGPDDDTDDDDGDTVS